MRLLYKCVYNRFLVCLFRCIILRPDGEEWRSSTVHSFSVLWQQKGFLKVAMMTKQHPLYEYAAKNKKKIYSSICQMQV